MTFGGVLFEIGGIGITNNMLIMSAITVFLTVLSYLATRNIREKPRGLQNVMEAVLEALQNFLGGMLDSDSTARRFLPFLASLFLFILICNYVGIPHFPGVYSPTATLSVTAGLALVSFIAVQFYGFKVHKLSYLKRFFSPLIILLLLEEFIFPFSLSLRLFGNIFGKSQVAGAVASLIPLLASLPIMVLGMLLGAVQALVFTLLTSIFIAKATVDEH